MRQTASPDFPFSRPRTRTPPQASISTRQGGRRLDDAGTRIASRRAAQNRPPRGVGAIRLKHGFCQVETDVDHLRPASSQFRPGTSRRSGGGRVIRAQLTTENRLTGCRRQAILRSEGTLLEECGLTSV
jgi:hypothetical protein